MTAAEQLSLKCATVAEGVWINTTMGLLYSAFQAQVEHWGLEAIVHRRARRAKILAESLCKLSAGGGERPADLERIMKRIDTFGNGVGSLSSLPEEIVPTYVRLCQNAGWYDSICVLAWAAEHPFEVAQYLWSLGATVLVVDEVQDLSVIEWRVLCAWVLSGGTIHIVGDPEQGINGFRGADLPSLIRFCGLQKIRNFELSVTWRLRSALTEYVSPLRQRLFEHDRLLVPGHIGGLGVSVIPYLSSGTSCGDEITRDVVREMLVVQGRPIPRSMEAQGIGRQERGRLDALGAAGFSESAAIFTTGWEIDRVKALLLESGVDEKDIVELRSSQNFDRLDKAIRVMLAVFDPWGKTAIETLSPSWRVRTLLSELRRRKGAALKSGTEEHEEVTALIGRIEKSEIGGARATLECARVELDEMKKRDPEGTSPLGQFASDALRLLDLVIDTERAGNGEAVKRAIQTLDAIFDLHCVSPKKGVRPILAPAAQLLENPVPPLQAAEQLTDWTTYARSSKLPALKDGQKRSVLSTTSGSKGLEFPAAQVVGLKVGMFLKVAITTERGVEGS